MTTHDESPIIRTSQRRLAIGIAIIVILLGIGTGIIVPFWKDMVKNPPPAFPPTVRGATRRRNRFSDKYRYN